MNVTLVSAYGPEARGSKTSCIMVISEDTISSPIVNEFDILVAFNEVDLKENKNIAKEHLEIYDNNIKYVKELLKLFEVDPKDAIPHLKKMTGNKYKERLAEGIKILEEE